MKNLFLFLFLFTTIFFIGCGDEGVVLDVPTTYDNAPSAPSITPEMQTKIPITAVTHIESEHVSPNLLITVYATHNEIKYSQTLSDWFPSDNIFTELEPEEKPREHTYRLQRNEYGTMIRIRYYFVSGHSDSRVYINLNNFQPVNPNDIVIRDPVDDDPIVKPVDDPIKNDPVDDPVNNPVNDPVDPVDDPVDDPVNDPVDNLVIKDEPPVVPRSIGEYVVWLEKANGDCQSGVIHSDYAFINYGNKTITFTGEDGQVDPGDTVRTYIKVETGLTYEQASKRAPEILSECSP